MKILLHIIQRTAWEVAAAGNYYKPASLDSDGFIHCSTIEQTVDTANQYYADQKDLLLLCIDEHKTEPEVRYEGPACVNDHRSALLFPHIYGPLNVSAVVRVVAFAPKADGKFVLPAEIRQWTV
jgi:uncharacterized protein (DUF952 family)